MLATLVIGLREGLEAALIVGIVAAFLRRNGHGLGAMWWGVTAAIAASLAVGGSLWWLEASLPQAAQEGLETVIGAIAVVFVTGMILWMGAHARTMKRDLEASAADALGTGTARALAVMAFLAVLKEGFESSVFLLATFRAAVNPGVAAAGALIGIAASIGIGIGIYQGGVRLNLARFFRVTGVFLLLVAAGLVLTAVRTAHEAGWLDGGQQRTLDLRWLAPPGSIQASLVTGVLGIPADPRLVEVIAWLAYLIPVGAVLLLPQRLRPRGTAAVATRFGIAAAAVVGAVVIAPVAALALAPAGPVPLTLEGAGTAAVHGTATVQDGGLRFREGDRAVARITSVPLTDGTRTERRGIAVTQHSGTRREGEAGSPTMTLDALVAANGGRVPVGIDPTRATGPFEVTAAEVTTYRAWTASGRLVDLATSTVRVLTLSGGGLTSPRTVTVGSPALAAATAASSDAAVAAVARDAAVVSDRLLWVVQVPLLLVLAGVLLAVATLVRRRREPRAATALHVRTTGSPVHAHH